MAEMKAINEEELSERESIARQLRGDSDGDLVDGVDVTNLSVEDAPDGGKEDWRSALKEVNEEDLGKGSADKVPDLRQRLNGKAPTPSFPRH